MNQITCSPRTTYNRDINMLTKLLVQYMASLKIDTLGNGETFTWIPVQLVLKTKRYLKVIGNCPENTSSSCIYLVAKFLVQYKEIIDLQSALRVEIISMSTVHLRMFCMNCISK
eukprot:TRINITY_DN6724_c0_g1_i1.p1 TRINITY_DN6724_c0_g1~~TRINITY_DN6724_c0_g1_i1.p1  ORF type:complete len:114 (+),score=1.80 TRINITY_DN6724_c0_g1_i1:279-620(+)